MRATNHGGTPELRSDDPVAVITDRLHLRPFVESDISSNYLGWLNDPAHMQFSNQRFRVHTKETSQRYLGSFADTPHLFLAILDSSTDLLVGTSTIYVNPRHGTADLGLLIGIEYSRQGFGEEAWLGMLGVCRTLGIRKATAGVLATNCAMVKIASATGMLLEGTRVGQEMICGEAIDQLLFGMFL